MQPSPSDNAVLLTKPEALAQKLARSIALSLDHKHSSPFYPCYLGFARHGVQPKRLGQRIFFARSRSVWSVEIAFERAERSNFEAFGDSSSVEISCLNALIRWF
jgi:hypothetical protein